MKCPYCYRDGIWSKDPLLTPYGSKFKWSDENKTTLEEETVTEDRKYVGMYQMAEEVQEIQDALKTLEEENLLEAERTIFSPINNTGYFQIKGLHIKEMRESVEKLLIFSDYTKTKFFNYDVAGNHITHPNGDKLDWTDVVENDEDWNKFQIKGIHIEELRHYIDIAWQETFPTTTLERSGISWTRTGTVITITKTGHELITGDSVTITVSSDETALSLGVKTVTKLTDDTFNIVGLSAGAISGTCTYTVIATYSKSTSYYYPNPTPPYPVPYTYLINDGFNLQANHLWHLNHTCRVYLYGVQSPLAILQGSQIASISSGILSFYSSGSLTYQPNGNYLTSALAGGYLHCNYYPTTVDKNITLNTKLSWTGTFTGTVVGNPIWKVANYANITLHCSSDIESFDIQFRKNGSGNVRSWTYSSLFIELANWSGNNINLYNLLVSAGKDMTKSYIVDQISFVLTNFGGDFLVVDQTYPLSSSTISVTLDNLRIGS